MIYQIDIEDDLVNFFKDNIDDSEPTESMLAKMLKFLRELLVTANKQLQN